LNKIAMSTWPGARHTGIEYTGPRHNLVDPAVVAATTQWLTTLP
jgi:hypothetical protein